MAFSQKHVGKVLVPWFNTAEWEFVYKCIYSAKKNWPKALEILKIWKLRTPLLSAGVEGTLIILQALLCDHQKSNYESNHVYSTALIRFLNLCAARSDRQGTFYKTAKKNELPKWLISLRHEIAHSHNLPSKEILELGVNFCLGWLEDKYWKAQIKYMNDYVISKTENLDMQNAIFVYLNLVYLSSLKRDTPIKGALKKSIKKFLLGRNQKRNLDPATVKVLTQDLVRESLNEDPEWTLQEIVSVLLKNQCLMLKFTPRDDQIPQRSVSAWNELLNLLCDTRTLLNFIKNLLNTVCTNNNSDQHRLNASLWIKEIYQAFLLSPETDDSEGRLFFAYPQDANTILKDRELMNEVLDHVNPYMENYVKEVLLYNNVPNNFMSDCLTILSAFKIDNNSSELLNRQVFTVDDIEMNGILDGQFNGLSTPLNTVNKQEEVTRVLGWKRIEDTTPYKSLPLGVLPGQRRDRNPLINFTL